MKRANEPTENGCVNHGTRVDEAVIKPKDNAQSEVAIRAGADVPVLTETTLERVDEQPQVTALPSLHGGGEIDDAHDVESRAQASLCDRSAPAYLHPEFARPLTGIKELQECLKACNASEEGLEYDDWEFKQASDMAKHGDPVAKYRLSHHMSLADCDSPSGKEQRLKLLVASAKKGWIPAHDALIWHFLHEDRSDEAALEWSRLKKACWPAFKELLEKESGTSPHFDQAQFENYFLNRFMWELQLARQGATSAQRRVARHLLCDGPSSQEQQRKAYVWLDRAAKSGDDKAMLALGMMYEHGIAVRQNRAEAIKLYRQAAESGQPEAVKKLCSLRERYKHAFEWRAAGLIPDGEDASDLGWCWRAVQQGLPEAKLYMAELLATGQGVAKDVKASFALCREAADAGLEKACYPLILMYLTGMGTDPDDEEALYYVHALGPEYFSAFCLGDLHVGKCKDAFRKAALDFGIQLCVNRKRAFRWYREAGWEGFGIDLVEKVESLVAAGDGAFIDEEEAREWKRYGSWDDGWYAVSSEEDEPAPEEIRERVEGFITDGLWKASRGECVNLSRRFADWSDFKWTTCLPKALSEAPRLRILFLDGNNLTDESAKDIAEVICQTKTLEVLDLQGNNFTVAAYQTLAAAMRSNFTLRRVHIDARLDSEEYRLIRGLCARNRNLQKLGAEFKGPSPLRTMMLPTELSELLEQHLFFEDQKDGTQDLSATRERVLEMLMCLQPAVLHARPVAKTT